MKKKLITILWFGLGFCLLALLVAARSAKNNAYCKDVRVLIEGTNTNLFLDEKEIASMVKDNGGAIGHHLQDIDLRSLESSLMQNQWIENARLFFDNSNNLVVSVWERDPIARVFTLQGSSFYIDSSCRMLPLSDNVLTRVPVFTAFTSSNSHLSGPDSSLLADVKSVAQYINADSFWTAFVSQVNITPQRTFEIIPVVGNTVIEIGNADSLDAKFNRLYSFYKEVWVAAGFTKYEKINVQYDNQVVATRKGGTLAQLSDTSQQQQPKAVSLNAAPRQKDSLPGTKPAVKPVVLKAKPAVKTQVPVKPAKRKLQPVLSPKKNLNNKINKKAVVTKTNEHTKLKK